MASKEQINFELLIEISKALKSIAALDSSSEEYKNKVKLLSESMKEFSAVSGMSFTAIERGMERLTVGAGVTTEAFRRLQQVIQDVRATATSMSAPLSGGGNSSGAPQLPAVIGTSMSRDRVIDGQVIDDVNNFSNAAENAANVVDGKVLPTITKVKKSTKDLGDGARSAAQGFSILRSAMGFLTAMGMSAIMQALTQFFSNALALATEFRGKMAELNFAEAVLSKKGMDITRKELDNFVKEIEDKYKYLSKSESIGIVSTVADMGAEFNLTKEKILGLSDAVAFITLRERAYGMEVSDTGSIVNAALDGRSNYFNKLGINITKTAIKEKAYAMGLAESGASISKEISNQAAIALLIEQTTGKYDDLLASIEQVNPALANQLRVSKELKDAQLEVGESVLTVKDSWNSFLSALIENGSFDAMKESLISTILEVSNLISAIENASDVITTFMSNMDALSGKSGDKKGGLIWRILTGGFAGDLVQSVANILATILAQVVAWIATMWIEVTSGVSFLKAWEDAGANAREAWKRGWEKTKKIFSGEENLFSGATPPKTIIEGQDTPTAPSIIGDEATNQNILDAEKKFNEAILDAQLKLGQDLEEAQIDYERKLYDISVEYKAKRLDLEKDYANKVADINRSYTEKITEINQKRQEDEAKRKNDELQKEREFQNRMLELKENFLLSLEDALQNRDARQVLKLTRAYELDKAQAERKHELDKQSAQEEASIRQQSYEFDRKKAEVDRKAKLAEAKRDYADKVAKLKLDEQAERKAANLAYERKKQDLEREMKNRLAIVAANLVQEFNLTQKGLDAIARLYLKYYNDVKRIYEAMRAVMGASVTSTGTRPPGGGGSRPGIQMAQGGSIIANRPTTVTFGEAGLEAATFMPLGRLGKDVGSTFSNVAGMEGSGGKVSIELLLSPDLESRIVSNSMDATAEVFMRTMRGTR
jgi:hypothetical protein